MIEASPEATIFHTPEWLEACTSSGDLVDASRLYETSDGTRMVLPAVRRPGHGLATTWSMPYFWGYGGVLSEGSLGLGHVASVLAAESIATGGRLVVKPGPHAADAWRAARPRGRRGHCVHVVDLRRGFGELWSSTFSSTTRNKVRKAEKRGVEFEWGTGDQFVDDFWRIYLRWSARRAEERGLPVRLALAVARRREPLARFEAMARAMGENFRVLLARVEGVPVAATVVLTWGAHAHYWRSASDHSTMGQRYANYLLMARMIEDAAERGHEYLDMGESGGVASLVSFKEKFGAQARWYDELRFEPWLVKAAVDGRNRMTSAAMDAAGAAAARLNRS